jgi:hypothetical protein
MVRITDEVFGGTTIEFIHHFSERFAAFGGYQDDHEFLGYRDQI